VKAVTLRRARGRSAAAAVGAPDESTQTATTEQSSSESVEEDLGGEAAALESAAMETDTKADQSAHDERRIRLWRRPRWSRVIGYGLLPALALLLAGAAGFLKWQDASIGDSAGAEATEATKAATDGTIALLSYRPDSVEKDLDAARNRLTGSFLNAYAKLTHDVVIPGSKQKQISAVATVPAAAAKSATAGHAVVLLFVDQTVIVGKDAPTSTASSVRVTLDKVDGRWLISQFDPV
jgi:Mce-associated membrane protein